MGKTPAEMPAIIVHKTELAEPTKYDDGKPPMDLLPPEALVEIAKVLGFGAQKYRANNWRLMPGFAWSRIFASLQRHLFAWQSGEDIDPESGMSHLAHAGCQLMFLLTYEVTGMGADDRFKAQDGMKGCGCERGCSDCMNREPEDEEA